MAYDKLVDSSQLDADLASVADAIRTKGGTSAQLAFPQGFVDAVEAIETGGGGVNKETEILSGTISGAYENNDVTELRAQALSGCNRLTSISFPNVTAAGANAFYNCTNISSLNLPKLARCSTNYIFSGIKKLQKIKLPALSGSIGTFAFSGDTILEAIDLGIDCSGFGGQCFASTALSALVLRRTKVVPLGSINNFSNSPFASGKAGGTLYVPQALIASYQSATNWSTILDYANNSIQAIEGSIYETQYADGTPIPTT